LTTMPMTRMNERGLRHRTGARRAEARVGQRGGVGRGIRAGKPVRRATRATSRSKGGGEAGDRRSPRGGTESDEPPTPPAAETVPATTRTSDLGVTFSSRWVRPRLPEGGGVPGSSPCRRPFRVSRVPPRAQRRHPDRRRPCSAGPGRWWTVSMVTIAPRSRGRGRARSRDAGHFTGVNEEKRRPGRL